MEEDCIAAPSISVATFKYPGNLSTTVLATACDVLGSLGNKKGFEKFISKTLFIKAKISFTYLYLSTSAS